MNPAFDTHKAVKDLTNAGAAEKLAEATVATINTAINEQAATKDDIKVVREDIKDIRGDIKDIRGDIKDIREKLEDVQEKLEGVQEHIQEHMVTKADLKTDLELLSKSMTIRLGVMLFAVAAVMIALFNATN